MESFLTFILIVVLAFYLIGWLGRILLRRWIARKQQEMAGRFTGNAGYGSRGEGSKARKEGEVTIQSKGSADKKVGRNVGDYVEYEEVEEE